jgi:nitroimidazol reductase NimA-like FMN-containing flavoprotein (pyridoxamine 5'-phosphate oxidase superfamily)
MFMPVRRQDRAAGRETALSLLRRGIHGVLSTRGGHGYPSGTPVNYVLDGESIYIHISPDGSLAASLAANPRVCFTVVGAVSVLPERFSCAYESAMAHGTARRVDDEEKQRALTLLCQKYSPGFMEQARACIAAKAARCTVYCLDIENLGAKIRNA